MNVKDVLKESLDLIGELLGELGDIDAVDEERAKEYYYPVIKDIQIALKELSE